MMKTKKQIILLIIAILIWITFTISYLTVKYIPSWYQPVYKSQVTKEQVTNELINISRDLNNKMQKPKAFTFTITDKQINQIIAGIDYIFPEIKEYIPEFISAPAVNLDNNELKVGTIIKKNGKKVFASLKLKLTANDKFISIDELKVYIGLWPMPNQLLEEKIQTLVSKLKKYVKIEDIDQIIKTRKIPNLFSFPNSDYDFKILELRAQDGRLYVKIQPITKTWFHATEIQRIATHPNP